MNARIGLRLTSFAAVVACAALVACGGGGGGGSVTPSTPTPAPTPPPTSQSATGTTGNSTATLSFGSVFNAGNMVITSASVGFPATSAVAALTATMSYTASTGASAPQIRMARTRNSTPLGVQSVLAYFSITPSTTAPVTSVTVTTTPAFTATFPGTLNPSNNYYVVFLDPSSKNATGWTSLGSATVQNGNTLAFASQPVNPAITFASQQPYYFALVSTGTNPIQTPAPNASITSGPGTPIPSPSPATHGGWLPARIVNNLQMPAASGWDGTGQTIAIVGDATPNPADVTAYLTAIGQANRPGGSLVTVFPNPSATPDGSGAKNGDDAEATLDVETVMGLAPGAKIEFYAIQDLSSQSFWDAEQYIYKSDTAKIESLSFGGCESQSALTDDQYFAAGLAKGVAYFASSGDQGNECFSGTDAKGNPIFTPGANNPASDPNVVAVGGNQNINAAQTALSSLTSTQVWNDSFLSGPGAGGGGVSALFTTLPSYQQGLAGVASQTARNVPDITLPSEGVAIYYQGSWGVFGGTSWSAPIGAALMAQLNEYCGGAPNNAVAMWYTAFSRSKTAYIDIVSGNNQFKGSSPFYSAAAGYDDASGLGLPIGTQVAAAMCPQRTWAFASAPRAMRASAYATYGEQRDTLLDNAINVRHFGDLGARSGSEPMTVAIALRETPTANGDVQAVLHDLRAAGFDANANGLIVRATASTATVESYFHTSIRNVARGNLASGYANATPVTVPASIAPYVGMVSADNLILRHRMSHRIR